MSVGPPVKNGSMGMMMGGPTGYMDQRMTLIMTPCVRKNVDEKILQAHFEIPREDELTEKVEKEDL